MAGLEAAWGTPDLIRNTFSGLAGDDLVVRSLAKLCRSVIAGGEAPEELLFAQAEISRLAIES